MERTVVWRLLGRVMHTCHYPLPRQLQTRSQALHFHPLMFLSEPQQHTLPRGWEAVTAAWEEEESGLADNETGSMHGISSYFNQSKNIHFIEGTLPEIVIWSAASILFPIKCTVHFNTKWKCILIFYRAAQISVLSKSTSNVKKINFQVRVYQILKAFKDQI